MHGGRDLNRSYFLLTTFEYPEQSYEAGSRVTLVMQVRKPRPPGQLDPTAWALGPGPPRCCLQAFLPSRRLSCGCSPSHQIDLIEYES